MKQWNLLGTSYGARVAFEAMRVTPQGIRSAVLVSPLPPNPPLDSVGAFEDVMRRLSHVCAAQSDCAAISQDLDQSLRIAIKELQQKPFVRRIESADGSREVMINGDRVAAIVPAATYNRRVIALIPLIIQEARRRNEAGYAPLAPAGGVQSANQPRVECDRSMPRLRRRITCAGTGGA